MGRECQKEIIKENKTKERKEAAARHAAAVYYMTHAMCGTKTTRKQQVNKAR